MSAQLLRRNLDYLHGLLTFYEVRHFCWAIHSPLRRASSTSNLSQQLQCLAHCLLCSTTLLEFVLSLVAVTASPSVRQRPHSAIFTTILYERHVRLHIDAPLNSNSESNKHYPPSTKSAPTPSSPPPPPPPPLPSPPSPPPASPPPPHPPPNS